MKLKVANPIYDVAFKYLMNDAEVARLMLSKLIDAEVLEVQFAPTEHHAKLAVQNLTVFHLDFAARIRLQDGSEKMVLIEIQKAKYPTDIMRFRRYLGQHYQDEKNTVTEADGKRQALPIFTIYFLGHKLTNIQAPVVKVRRACFDAATGERLEGRDPFVEALTHDSVVIQIPLLSGSSRTDLEKLLSVFDQARRDPDNRHIVEVDEETYPSEYRRIVKRLLAAISDKEVEETMRIEDEVLDELQRLERIAEEKAQEAEKQRRIAEEKAREAQEQRQEAEEQRRIAEEKAREAEKKERALQATRRAAIEALVKAGVPREKAETLVAPVPTHDQS